MEFTTCIGARHLIDTIMRGQVSRGIPYWCLLDVSMSGHNEVLVQLKSRRLYRSCSTSPRPTRADASSGIPVVLLSAPRIPEDVTLVSDVLKQRQSTSFFRYFGIHVEFRAGDLPLRRWAVFLYSYK